MGISHSVPAQVDCSGKLSFATANTHKMASESSGSYVVYDERGSPVATGSVTWEPHWQRTTVDVDYDASTGGTIEIVNQYDSSSTTSFTC